MDASCQEFLQTPSKDPDIQYYAKFIEDHYGKHSKISYELIIVSLKE